MSMMKSLARVAAGVMLAKGIGSVMKNRQQGGSTGQSQGGGLLGGLLSNNTGGSGGGLSQMLGNRSGGQGSLGGLLDKLGGSGGAQGGLGAVLGGLVGGSATAGQLTQKDSQPSNDATFGALFDDAITHEAEPQTAPTPEQNAVAALMLRAMIQAAKSDGHVDDAEKQRLLGHLGDDLDDDERNFIREQMSRPVNAQDLARDVPKGLEAQVYLMSLLAIDFDSEAEARYLNDLATAMGLDRTQVNDIHREAGVTPLYNGA
ncbi:DUF533 domain-containing protein [Paracoccus sp. 1_MG-2023]|uniref:DUF533 domain-containing protein n=1 Tax=unclassified Paracoccus (in: a-proteobacteria) TaxID=2688777 RepID=UPI001C0A0BBF|nr:MULTISPECIES: DUF533 domain-containing protein [unclassified Paracoccus (in: a-proteobacteria)]MBU2956515.1 tellurite resistance TerB family protein [Paracoccus sp. C2R09]MDO6669681.1 DUF533 domain-containing protein [Paracoccus sp. 1_MG-2023]